MFWSLGQESPSPLGQLGEPQRWLQVVEVVEPAQRLELLVERRLARAAGQREVQAARLRLLQAQAGQQREARQAERPRVQVAERRQLQVAELSWAVVEAAELSLAVEA